MKKVKMYTTPICGYCVMAKRLLQARDIAFEEIDVAGDSETRIWLVETTGRRTVPQLFIGDESIGGYQELAALDRSGALQMKLRDEASP